MPFAASGPLAIHYEIHGGPVVAGGPTPALLMMGLAADAHGWEKQIPALSVDRAVIAFDNRGVGRSAKPVGPYSTEEMAADALAVLDAAGVERAHVVGLSLGGLVAQHVTLRYAERVRSLALLSTFAQLDPEAWGDRRPDLESLLTGLAAGAENPNFMILFSYLTKLGFSTDYLKKERGYLQSFFARSAAYGISAEGLLGQVQAVLLHDSRAKLVDLNTPTLVAFGSADALVPPELSRRLAAGIQGSTIFEIDGAAHNSNLECAEIVNKLLAPWFLENDQGESTANLRTIG